MEYRLRPDRPLDEEVRKIAHAQLDAAIGGLSSARNTDRSVHEARKCLKRVRSLVRLLRPALGEKSFKREDRRIRNIARTLSRARDSQAMIETVSRIEMEDGRIWGAAEAQSLKSRLHRDRAKSERDLQRHGLRDAIEGLRAARQHYRTLKLKARPRHIAEGLGETYRQSRNDFLVSYKKEREEDFHNWRKSAQQHWRQMLLLWHAWPAVLEARAELAYELSQLLGFDHDLSVLMDHMRQQEKTCSSWNGEAFYDACKSRQQIMRVSARPLGERLFSERPRDFRDRMRAYWRTARRSDGLAKTATDSSRPIGFSANGHDEHPVDLA